jgi:hypothetical protein
MSSSTGSDQFPIWVVKLGGRVRSLQSKASYADLDELEREANTCEANLKHLYDHGLQHNINFTLYLSAFSEIEANLHDVRHQIEARRRPWWKTVVEIVVRALGIVADIIGVGSFLRLGSGGTPPLLPPGK